MARSTRHVFLPLAAALILNGCAGRSAIRPDEKRTTAALRFDARVDVPVGAVLGGAGIALVVARPLLASTTCHFSCTPGEVLGIDALAREARWSNVSTAHTLGNIVGYGGLPTLAFASGLVGALEGQSKTEVFQDTWIIAEAFALAHVLESIFKYTVGRARPDTTFAAPGTVVEDPSDRYTSMVSGHATAAFAVAVATGTVATLRGRHSAPWLWAAGVSIAVASSYLRIAGDRHYLTDVLGGAALGTAMGFAVPLLFHGRTLPVTVAPWGSAAGGGLALSGHW